jgi:hypothetical protein
MLPKVLTWLESSFLKGFDTPEALIQLVLCWHTMMTAALQNHCCVAHSKHFNPCPVEWNMKIELKIRFRNSQYSCPKNRLSLSFDSGLNIWSRKIYYLQCNIFHLSVCLWPVYWIIDRMTGCKNVSKKVIPWGLEMETVYICEKLVSTWESSWRPNPAQRRTSNIAYL